MASKKREVTNEMLGARLRQAREAKGFSQSTLGDKVGVSFQAIAKYEKGSARLLVVMLIKLARALGIEPKELLP